MGRARSLVAVLLVGMTAYVVAVGAAAPSSFILGVLIPLDEAGWDLLPVARFDGRAWKSTWPPALDEDTQFTLPTLRTIPHSWIGGRVPQVWTIWNADGTRRRARVTGLSRMNGASGAIVLRTEPVAVPDVALAFNRVPNVEAVVDVRSSVLEADSVELTEIFTAAEERTLGEYRKWQKANGSGPPPYPLVAPIDVRRNAPIEIRRLFRPLKTSTATVYYVEAIKRFPASEDGADLITLSGWLRASDGRVAAIEVVAGHQHSGEYVESATPLGIIRAAGRHVWVSYVGGFESAVVTLTDVSPAAIKDLIVAQISG
jgi:hypothetical protein